MGIFLENDFSYKLLEKYESRSAESLVSNLNGLRTVWYRIGSYPYVKLAIIAALYYKGIDISVLVDETVSEDGTVSISHHVTYEVALEGDKLVYVNEEN